MALVVGLHAFGHEAGACVMTPNGPFALSEERLSRRKYDGGFPERSLRWALAAAGVAELADVDLVVYDLIEESSPRVLEALTDMGYGGAVRACRHHDAHAAAAYFASPYEDAAVLTLDAGGSREGEKGPGVSPSPWQRAHPAYREVQARYRGHGRRLHTLRRTVVGPEYSINPGVLYGLTAMFLGCGELGAGKVMGLAGYGRPDPRFRRPLFELFDGDPLAPCALEDPLRPEVIGSLLPDWFDGVQPVPSTSELTPRHEDVAAHVQRETSDAVLHMVRHLLALTRAPRLCLSGGFGLNVLTNSRILRETPLRELFVQPAATDSGIPLGCALWGYHQVLGEPRSWTMTSAALGGAYGPDSVERALTGVSGVVASRPDDLALAVAEALSRSRIVGWFQGRSEYGPRALGHRSILADPRQAATKDRLNSEIKHREAFRPYAPLALASRATVCFDLPAPSPFMLLAAEVRPEWRDRIPAVTHVDGTARVQTVTPDEAPLLAAVLSAFEDLTGVPVLLNTSLNGAGDPIVETPEAALALFLGSGMDVLVLGNVWVEKTP